MSFENQINNCLGKIESPLAIVFVANQIINDSRVLKTANSLKEMGYYPVIAGTTKNGNEFFEYEGIQIIRINNFSNVLNEKNGGWLSWCEKISETIFNLIRNLPWSLIYTHDMWGFQFGYKLANEKRSVGADIYWVHDIHEDIYGYDNVLSPDKTLAAQELERKYIKSPDLIVTVNEYLALNISERYEYTRNLKVVYNSPKILNNNNDLLTIRDQLEISENCLLGVYAGKANKWRGLDVLVEALCHIENLHIAIVSDSDIEYLNKIKAKAKLLNVVDRIHFVPQVPHYFVPEFLSTADFGISLLLSYGNTENCLPTKIPDYLHAKLPVIVSNRMLQAKFVAENNIGIVVEDSESADLIIEAIELLKEKKDFFIKNITSSLLLEYEWDSQFIKVKDAIFNKISLEYSGVFPGMRIFQGPGSNAGQPSALAKSLRKKGFNATAVCVTPPNKYGYSPDYVWLANDERSMAALAHWSMSKFDLFHYHARPIMWSFKGGQLRVPALADMIAAKAAGKTVVFSFRGGEARIFGDFQRLSPYAWSIDQDYADFLTDTEKRKFVESVSEIADIVTVTDPELGSYVPDAYILPRSIDCSKWKYIGQVNRTRPLVVHAPSREVVKGSEYVISAINSLIEEGVDFDFKLIKGLKNEDARKIYEEADIIIDQLRIGWYGVLAVEGMALGKTVITYIREDLTDFFDGPSPVVNANPLNVTEVLRKCISDADLRYKMGINARKFCEDYHDDEKVAERLLGIYEQAKLTKNNKSPTLFINHLVNFGIDYKKNELQLIKANKSIKILRSQNVTSINEGDAVLQDESLRIKTGRKKLFDPPYSKIIPRILRRIGLKK